MIKFVTGMWLTFMLILSHISGGTSGEESRWLSVMIGVEEGLLRRSAHVVVYTILAALLMTGWADTPLWIKCLVLVSIALIDESSKALGIFQGRHCSVYELGLNLIGVGLGVVIGLLVTKIASCK